MRQAVIVSTARTPIGKAYRGSFNDLDGPSLAAQAMKAATSQASVEGGEIDDVILGCANQAGEDNRNVARMAALLAGLPATIPGTTINRLCASSLDAVGSAARAIRSGDGSTSLAISPRCPRLIEALQCYHYPDSGRAAQGELPIKDGLYDHPIDALRYFFTNHRHTPQTTARRY